MYSRISDIPNYDLFREHGQFELCKFLATFLGINSVRIQNEEVDKIKEWLEIKEFLSVNHVPKRGDNEICLVSQIVVDKKVIAYYPYVLEGRNVSKLAISAGFLTRITEVISEQMTACYLRGFTGGDWLFGETFAQRMIANCISKNSYNGTNFAHLIEKMEQLSVSTFEGSNFTTGVIVTKNYSHYQKNRYRYLEEHYIDEMDKRDWFLADGKKSFFLMNRNTNVNSIFIVDDLSKSNFIDDYFTKYYLYDVLNSADFIVRTVGPNEISVSDAYKREFVKVENIWRYRDKRQFEDFLVESLSIDIKLCNAIIYYSLKCSRKHISSIIWIPNDTTESVIESLTTSNRVRIWKKKLNMLCQTNEPIIEKILASDGAIVVEKNGDIMYESVFAKAETAGLKVGALVGSGETATKVLAQNGVAIKISQDGTIKIFSGDESLYY